MGQYKTTNIYIWFVYRIRSFWASDVGYQRHHNQHKVRPKALKCISSIYTLMCLATKRAESVNGRLSVGGCVCEKVPVRRRSVHTIPFPSPYIRLVYTMYSSNTFIPNIHMPHTHIHTHTDLKRKCHRAIKIHMFAKCSKHHPVRGHFASETHTHKRASLIYI